VGPGGTCHTATDCEQGLYCFGIPEAGICTSNANKAQPKGDASSYPDGGLAPMLDGGGGNKPPKDSATDTAAPTDTGTPADTGTPVDTGAPTDTGTPTDSRAKD
jgi:hypothetical protein